MIFPQKYHEDNRSLTYVTDFKDDEKISTFVIHKDNFSSPFDDMTSRDVSSITYLSSSEYSTPSLQAISETFPSNEFHVYGEKSSSNDTIVPLKYQSFHEMDSSDTHTSHLVSNYTKSETQDETSIDDLCDSSTYGIAEEFYHDLECFITSHNEDNISKDTSSVIEFELLSHDLLHHHNPHLNLSIEDHQNLPDNFTNNEDSLYDPEYCLYNLEDLEVILFDYEELSKDFELIIRSSTNNSGMILTTTGADNIVPLGRVFYILTSMLPNNVMLEIRTPPDKCIILNIAIDHCGKLLCPNMNDGETPDRDPSVVGHPDDCTRNTEIHKIILSNYGELPTNFDFMKISSHLVTYMTESSDMVNTAIKSFKFVSPDRVLTMFIQMPSNNPMLELRIPPDKCTVLNIAITHGEERQHILPERE